VTYNDDQTLASCLDSVFSQTAPVEVAIFDNASTDGSCGIAESFDVRLTRSGVNLGYSAGHNDNLRSHRFDYALLLNSDVILETDYLENLIQALRRVENCGMAGGKLLRMDTSGHAVLSAGYPVIDSTGVYFTPSQRHFDRGSGEQDRGQYEVAELVFGVTGAALFLKRELYDDLLLDGDFLDEDFFVYREDADLAWRAQLRGWKAVYEPGAVAHHVRRVLPSRRGGLPEAINSHSVKNRFLMRWKNMDSAVRWKCFPAMWFRDLGILGYVFLFERSSLKGLRQAVKLRNKMLEKRRRIESRRRAPAGAVAEWFDRRPQTKPLP
jgi:GT2 family glycosyltransferase